MDTKQKTRPAAQQGRSPAKKKKKTLMQKILGGGKKPAARSAAAPASRQTGRPASNARPTPEEIARRREAAARKARMEQQAASAQLNAAEQALPEEVFNTAQQTRKERTPEEKKRLAMRKKSAKRSKEREKEAKKAANRPAVTYTQPMPFNLNKLLLQLTVVIAVVLAVVIGLSVFFKVDRVVVYGNKAYSAWTIQEASGIEGGENLLSFGRTRACGKIITALPYVKNVRIGINLPDTVNIYIEEFDVSYAVESADGIWWLMTSGGKITEQINKSTANSYTKIVGVQLDNPSVGNQATAKEEPVQEATPEETADPLSTEEATAPAVIVTANDRLQAALLLLDSLELNDIVGEVASVDVTSLFNLELMYGQRYQVKLGDTSNMDYKISMMKKSVAQLNDYQTGILDVSFTTWPDEPFYTPLA